MSSREQRKQAAREARLEAERREAGAAQRRRRLSQLGGVVLVAAAVVAVLVAISSGGGSKPAAVPASQSTTLLGGLPQKGLTLGSAKAPITLVEFNDMQCPICRDYMSAVFPTLVTKYVRTGKLRMQMQLQSFIGPDSVTAGKAVAAAAKQNRAWTFADIFYGHQGQENSGYVTPDFVKSIAAATPGLNHSELVRDASAPAAGNTLKQGTNAFDTAGFSGTPSFLVGKTGGPLQPLNWSSLTPGEFTSKINELLA
jgi:protein-disulfide isomerase